MVNGNSGLHKFCYSHRDCLASQRCHQSQCSGAYPDGSRCVITEDCFQGSFCGRDMICRKDGNNYVLSIVLFLFALSLCIFMATLLIFKYRKRQKVLRELAKVPVPVQDETRRMSDRSQPNRAISTITILVDQPNVLVQHPFLLSITPPLQHYTSQLTNPTNPDVK
jgi:hypothetical protein